MSSANKRQSVLPRVHAGPRAPVNVSNSVIIADSAVLQGTHTINISSESAVHPRAKLDSSDGRVTIGRRCIIAERTHIGAHSLEPGPRSEFGVVLDDYVNVEVGAIVESGGTIIGEGCVIGTGAIVGKGAKLGKVGHKPSLSLPTKLYHVDII
jgi:dynactin 6